MSPDQGSRVALYIRVSTDKQALDGHSLDGQRRRLEKYALDNGLQVVSVIVDKESAGEQNRSRVERIRSEAEGVDALLVTKGDRIARSTRDLLNLHGELQASGIALVLVDEDSDTSTPQGKAMFTMRGAFAEYEREMTKARTRQGMVDAKAKGRHVGRPPLGYDMDSEERGCLVPNAFYPLVVRVHEMRSGGSSLQAIADRLTAEEVPTSTGAGTWFPATVSRVLRSPLQ